MSVIRTSCIVSLTVIGFILLLWPFGAFAQVARLSTSSGTIMPDARTIFIESANLPGDGIIVVGAERNGRMAPAALGQIRVPRGESTALKVPLTRESPAGHGLVVTLHADYGRRGVYDPADPSVLSVDIPPATVAAARR